MLIEAGVRLSTSTPTFTGASESVDFLSDSQGRGLGSYPRTLRSLSYDGAAWTPVTRMTSDAKVKGKSQVDFNVGVDTDLDDFEVEGAGIDSRIRPELSRNCDGARFKVKF